MLSDRERLNRQKSRPLLVELHRALSRLTSVLTVMSTGAHPDDEQSGMLATLRFQHGMRLVIANSTRGEGGQNSLGPERGAALGVLRTAEMEEAARRLDADLAWLGFGPADPVHDFGFSKNGEDTMARWGRDRVLERLVRAYRRERPDIVIPTFLDVPGQHGHHRAMTEAAAAAIALAADPEAFPLHLAEGLTPWQVAKFYLPAWSGGGGTYDDELPPPNASVEVIAEGPDPATGAAYAEIGEWSHGSHLSQGMGRWQAEPQTVWPLHLQHGPEGGERSIAANLPADLGELGSALGGEGGAALRAAHAAISRARAEFPRRAPILAALAEAAGHLQAAEAGLAPADRVRHGHRLSRKRAELDSALGLAAGLAGTAWLDPAAVPPGGSTTLFVRITGPDDLEAGLDLRLPETLAAGASDFAEGLLRLPLQVAADARPTSPFTERFSSLSGPAGLALALTAELEGRTIRLPLELDEPFAVIPAQSLRLTPEALIVPRDNLPLNTTLELQCDGPPAPIALTPHRDVTVTPTATGFDLTLEESLPPGRHHLPLHVGDAPAYRLEPIAYPHIPATRILVPQALDILVLDLALPPAARIGYVGGGSDNVGLWLDRLGLDATHLDAAALAGDLSAYTTIVVGIFAFGLRPDLAAATARLRAWVEAGGHLVTLYHRPTDNWHPDTTPPRRLVIGSPSLRWRVTDPAAPVTVLAPTHPLLAFPNRIGPADWQGWDKERGLYFAADWDPAYEPLLAMSDAGEAPLRGALVSARIGAGRHTHCALVLHHQLDKLVPGAFRLLANLLQPAS